LLSRWPDHPRVDLVTTDGFLYPNATLKTRGLMERKGFPESYDVRRMIQFLADIRLTGRGTAPLYSHHVYDVRPEVQVVENPDILIFEGLNVLQIGVGYDGTRAPFTASDGISATFVADCSAAAVAALPTSASIVAAKSAPADFRASSFAVAARCVTGSAASRTSRTRSGVAVTIMSCSGWLAVASTRERQGFVPSSPRGSASRRRGACRRAPPSRPLRAA